MKKKHINILIFCIYLVLTCVSLIKLTNSKEKQKITEITAASEKFTYFVKVLIEDSTAYIPNFGIVLFDVDPEPKNIEVEKFEPKHKKPWITKAFYNLYFLPEDKINELLYSPYPNLRIYGYILNIKKTHDVYFDYLLQSLENRDKVYFIFEQRWVYGECYVSDILLLLGLKGQTLPVYIAETTLTAEQKSILKDEYKKKEPINPYMDQLIQYYFDYEEEDIIYSGKIVEPNKSEGI